MRFKHNLSDPTCGKHIIVGEIGDSVKAICEAAYKMCKENRFDVVFVEFNGRKERVYNTDSVEDIIHKLYSNARKNAEGYDDPTAYEGVKRADRSREDERETVAKLMGCIRRVCELSGYTLENRVVLKNIKTGKLWD